MSKQIAARTREKWVDDVKVIACILVALGHFFMSMVQSGILPDSNLHEWFITTIYYFHVPLFFICSGYLYQKYSKVDSVESWHRNVAKKALALGVPYATFTTATWILKKVFSSTPIEFRAIGDYGKIANIKFVCGPLGGGESLPNGLKDYAKGHEIIEVVRSGINRWYRFKLRITGKLNRCDYIMFANKETQEFLVGGGRELNCPYELVFDNGLRPDELVNWTEKEKGNEELQCK